MLKQTESKSKYFSQAMATLVIDMDHAGAYARVPSEAGKKAHTVRIDERCKIPVATKCDCADCFYRKRTCKHMQIVTAFYARIAAIFEHEEIATIPVGQVMAEAQEAMEQFEHEQLQSVYAQIGDPRKADSCFYCGYICRGGICSQHAA